MDYIRKICPICKNEFIVLNTAQEKAVYCTIKCLSESKDNMHKNTLSLLETQYDDMYGLQ
jgi:hypothetical protein